MMMSTGDWRSWAAAMDGQVCMAGVLQNFTKIYFEVRIF